MLKSPPTALLCLVLGLTTPAAASDYYKWVDAAGSIHFSDSLAGVPPQYRDQIEAGEMTEPAPTPVMRAPDDAPPASASPATSGSEATAAAPPPPDLPRYEVQYQEYEGRARRILVQARFNDRITAPMALDTGSPDTVISLALAQRLGLFEGDEGTLFVTTGGIGGAAPAIRIVLDKVAIGGAVNNFVPATVIGAPISGEFDGLIGMGFVSSYQVNIDPTRSVIVFQELPASDAAPGGHSEQWWRNTFKDFALYKNGWRRYRDDRRRESRAPSGGIYDPVRLKYEQAFAEAQYRDAEKLYDKLNRYAIEHYVPMAWRE